jgi:hypothetical protein
MLHIGTGWRLMAILSVMAMTHGNIHAAKCPCDIYAAGGTPCVAAHSTTRALYTSYNGPLYQVRRTSDNATRDIGVLVAGGYANTAVQDSFLAGGKTGTISKIYDQSPNGNHLTSAPGGWYPTSCIEASLNVPDAKIKANGNTVYGVYVTGAFEPKAGVGYRNDRTKGVITGNNAEGMYMVCGGKHYNQYCCFDYGNAQTGNYATGNATMECLYFGNSTEWSHGSGSGPWVLADYEAGLFAGVDTSGSKNWANNTTISADYVSATLKSKTTNFWTIRGGNADSGKLKTMYGGRFYPGWYPKKLEGAIVLGIGGDNSHMAEGTFFEGAMTSGFPADSTEDSVQANILAAGYGKTTPPVSARHDVNEPTTGSPFSVHYNPSNGMAVLNCTLRDARQVSMNIFDQRGRRIAAIAAGIIQPGGHAAVWSAKRAPAGVYVCRISLDGIEGWAGKIVVGK